MEEDKQEFKRNLDELIKLFRKLKNKTSIENMPGVDKAMVQNFEVFLSNYDNMKDHITDDLFDQFGVPMRQMIADLVSQLKSELSQEEILEFKNLTEIEKTEGKTFVVCGKVLSQGGITKKVKVVALSFSEKAKEKLKAAGCETLTIAEEIQKNKDAKEVIILQ